MTEPGAPGAGRGFLRFRLDSSRFDMAASPYPKPDPDLPQSHLSRLADELGYLAVNVRKLKDVPAGEAADVRQVAADLADWVRVRLERGVELR